MGLFNYLLGGGGGGVVVPLGFPHPHPRKILFSSFIAFRFSDDVILINIAFYKNS